MITIDKDKCVSCGACQSKCPFQAIVFSDKYPEVTDKCRACGACVNVCPVDAITLKQSEKKASKDWRGVLVFGEQVNAKVAPVVYELLGKGRELADELGQELMCVILCDEAEDPKDLISYGADKVYVISDKKLAVYNSETYANVLADFIRRTKPNIFLVGATNEGRELAPRTSTRLRAGLTADCTILESNDEGLLVQTRPAFGGNIMASIVSPYARPQMATVRYKVMQRPKPHSREGEVIHEKPDPKLLESPLEVVEECMLEQGEDIVNADVIVAGGKGMGKKENFMLLGDLACMLGGCVGASRPAIDANWAQYPHQVGLSGRVVKPTLYVACGISGAIQHSCGMEASEHIIAVNKDPQAPIFEISDFGIVGDIEEILPALISEIDKRKKKP